MRRLVSVSALLTVLAATSLHAQNVAATADVPAATAKPAKVKKVCRSESVIGSNIPATTCHTQDEWVAIDNATRANAREMMNHNPQRR